MTEEIKQEEVQEVKKPKVKKLTAEEKKEQFNLHQEFAELKFRYVKLKPDAKKKFSKKERMNELEEIVKKFKGPKANTLKGVIGKTVRVKSRIVRITADYPNPSGVTELFTKGQLEHYFQV